MMNLPLSTQFNDKEVIMASELLEVLAQLIAENGDQPVSIGLHLDYREVLRFGDIDILE